MKKRALLLTAVPAVALLSALSGCSSVPEGQVAGNDMNHLSLRDKRMAEKQVQVLETTPSSFTSLGEVASERCQPSMFSEAPEDKSLIVDMRAEAYRLGANAITDIKVEKRGAMGKGCWNIYKATANMLVVE